MGRQSGTARAVTCAVSEIYAARRSLLWSGVMLGIGVIGTLDGVILHELLQWHKFYVHTTEFWRTFIDGLFHLVTAAFLFAGAYRLWVTRHLLHRAGRERVLWAGILFGMGGFNLYDGIVQHKIFQLHPVREGVDGPALLPYDLVFNALAVLLLLGGWFVLRSARAGQD